MKVDVLVRVLDDSGRVIARGTCSAVDLAGRERAEQETVVSGFARECLSTILDLYEARLRVGRL